MLDGWAVQGATAHGAALVYLVVLTRCMSIHVYSAVVWFSSSSASLSARADYWRKRAEKDAGQDTTNPHILAERIISQGKQVTHTDVNTVLQDQGISVNEKQLEELKAIQPETHSISPPPGGGKPEI